MGKLRKYFEYLTGDQERAVDFLERFIKSRSHNCFILQGYAGTGKTFLISGIVKFLKSLGMKFILMSPTGRGASVITEKVGEQAWTIHRTIYNFDDIEIYEADSSGGGGRDKGGISEGKEGYHYRFRYKLRYENNVNTVFIVDESSMVSDIPMGNDIIEFGSGQLLFDLIRFTRVNEPKLNNKIIFIGDPAQLPPVNMNFAPALNARYLAKKYNLKVTGAFLRQIVRQVGNSPILRLAHQVRGAIERNEFNYLDLIESENIKFIRISEVLNYIDVDKVKNNRVFIITSENKQTIAYNYIIKSNLFNSDTLKPGDKLMIFRNNYAFNHELYNGQLVEVISIDKPETFGKIRFRDVILKYFDYSSGKDVEVRCKVYENFIYSPEPEIQPEEWGLIFKVALDKNPFLRKVYEEYRNLKKRGKVLLRLTQVAVTLAKLIKDDPYLNAVFAKFGYSSTCHKAQGGEWDEVFIDMKTYMSKSSKLFFNWFYTAVTRAKLKLYLINYVPLTPLSKAVLVEEIQYFDSRPTEDEVFYFPEDEKAECNIKFNFNFQRRKYMKLVKKFREKSVKLELVNQFDWRDRYRFVSGESFVGGDYVIIDFIYNLNGYTGRYEVIRYSSEEFRDKVISILGEQLIIEPPSPSEKWKFYLYSMLRNMCNELGIKITNIVYKEFVDMYYFFTGLGIALIEFWYDKKNMYTKIIPKSEVGEGDEKFKVLLSKLKEVIEHVRDNKA